MDCERRTPGAARMVLQWLRQAQPGVSARDRRQPAPRANAPRMTAWGTPERTVAMRHRLRDRRHSIGSWPRCPAIFRQKVFTDQASLAERKTQCVFRIKRGGILAISAARADCLPPGAGRRRTFGWSRWPCSDTTPAVRPRQNPASFQINVPVGSWSIAASDGTNLTVRRLLSASFVASDYAARGVFCDARTRASVRLQRRAAGHKMHAATPPSLVVALFLFAQFDSKRMLTSFRITPTAQPRRLRCRKRRRARQPAAPQY